MGATPSSGGDGEPGGVRRDPGRGCADPANMTEFGKSDLSTTRQLADVGVNLVIFPVSLLRLAMGAAERGLDSLLVEGSLAAMVPEMQTRARLYELIDYAGYSAFDENVYNFHLSHNRS
jgi:methylisocitrate lyase